jgi:protein-L-isoaspartate O-methyltransferase
VPLNRADAPEQWLALVNSGESVITQVDDGSPRGEGKGILATSSSSKPPVMADMLDLLDVRAGTDVLEIGTGTGYNAAVIAERAAPGRVTTVEIDPEIAEHGRRVLRTIDRSVTVVTGDGTLGYPEHAPYAGVMCTASALEVPYPWVAQSRIGGRIVVPLAGGFKAQAFLCLTVAEDGCARGGFRGPASFMRLRNQRDGASLWRIWNKGDASVTITRRYPGEPFFDFDAGFALGLLLRGWTTNRRVEDSGAILLMSHHDSESWATITPRRDGAYEVQHEGPRRLWEELDAAYQWWIDAGRPDHTRFGLTVSESGQDVWLDSPNQVIETPGPSH